MRKILIALAAGTVIGLSPMFAEQADAQRRGFGGGFSGARGIGGGWGGRGLGVRSAGLGWGGRGLGVRGLGVRPAGLGWGGRGLGVRHAGLGWGGRGWGWGRPGFRRAGWGWGVPLAVGVGIGVGAYSSCYQWDPYYGWVNVCAVPVVAGYGYGYYGGQWW